MNKRRLQAWESTRKKGRSHFIWVRGVLCFGLTMAIVMTLFHSFRYDEGNRLIDGLVDLMVYLMVFPIVGYIWGSLVWKITERKYQEAKKKLEFEERKRDRYS